MNEATCFLTVKLYSTPIIVRNTSVICMNYIVNVNYDKNSKRDTISSDVLVWLQTSPDSPLLRLPLHDY